MTTDFSILNASPSNSLAPLRDNIAANNSTDEAQAKRVALEFESVLLQQLTASLNPKEDEESNDESNLFGGSSGSGVYRQMFSEQIASTMAQSGGIGLSDIILQQLHSKSADVHAKATPNTSLPTNTARALHAARQIRESSSAAQPAAKNLAPNATAVKDANFYPEAVIISEAASEASAPQPLPAPSTTSFTSNSSLGSLPSSSVDPIRAVRPRRVFDNAPSANDARMTLDHAFPARSAHVPLQMPLQNGRISSNFGVRHDPINGHERHHEGVDIAAPRGTPIASAGDGTVIFAGWQRGYGNTVIVEHGDGRRTRYAHAEKLFVHPGEIVGAGQTIAAVGSTGHSTGPHLHFEVIEGERPVDPLRALANDLTLARR